MDRLLSTRQKRAAIAALVGEAATKALGLPVKLVEERDFAPGEWRYRIEDIESERGPVDWISLEVDSFGVSVHIRFGFKEFAPPGGQHNGKWNHYLWPEKTDTLDSYRAALIRDLAYVLGRVKVRPGVVRCDRPGMRDYWAAEFSAMQAAG